MEILAQQVQHLSEKIESSNAELQFLRERQLSQDRSGTNLVFRAFSAIHKETILQKSFGELENQSHTIKMSDVTSDAKFVLADIFINDKKNDHFTITFSDKQDCSAQLWADKSSGKPPPDHYDHKSQKAILMFDASQDGKSYPRWGQWT